MGDQIMILNYGGKEKRMGDQIMILNYATNTIIKGVSISETCAILKALMKMPNPSFDIVSKNEFVTADFVEMNDDSWKYEPAPRAARQ